MPCRGGWSFLGPSRWDTKLDTVYVRLRLGTCLSVFVLEPRWGGGSGT